MIAVVLDCNVILQSMLRRDSVAFACLTEIEKRDVRIQISAEMLAEYRDVLTREKLRRKFPVLTPTFVDEQLEQLLARADFWEDVPKHFTLSRDPKDECYLNLAIESGAKYLASRDLDLLDLMNDAEFVAKHPSLIICEPVQFLTILRSL